MDPDYWKGEWKAGRTRFHEGKPNALLVAHAGFLRGARRVLVPLCGKTEDMAFLASQGHEVVGIEVAEEAAHAFFAEHGLTPTVTGGPRLRRVAAGGVTILVGDFFAVTAADAGELDGYYDRAAVIALPPELRARYVPHVRALLGPRARGVVITVTYDEAKLKGPPFSVGETELRALWAGAAFDVLAPTAGQPTKGGRSSDVGALEHVYGITL